MLDSLEWHNCNGFKKCMKSNPDASGKITDGYVDDL